MKSWKIGGCLLGLLIAVIVIAAVGFFIYKIRENNLAESPTIENPPTNPTNNQPNPPEETSSLNKFLPLGNPSNAVFNQSSSNNYLMTGEYYSLSYNRAKAIPNWVMWRINKNSFGDIQRQNDFRPDERLPDGWTQITPYDYNGSGYDRGHLCPSADRSSSLEANSSTFLMTNIAPQTHSLNAGPWEKLESYSRSAARRNMTLYIIAGQYGEKGKIRKKITIPTNFWKIVIAVPDGTQINKNSRIVAVDMPNIDGIDEANWRDYATTVQKIEQKTGYNFLSSLPVDVQNTLKSKIDVK